MSGQERKLDILPAWDRTDPDPAKNYGIHGVEMRWVLKGEKGATQFVLFTHWMLPEVERRKEQRHLDATDYRLSRPMAADLGFHARELPTGYDGDDYGFLRHDDCHILGGPCYYDGSGLNAEPVFERLVREGGEAVWQELESYYDSLFAAPVEGKEAEQR